MLSIIAIPAFEDNYIWMLREPPDRRVAVVDPGDEAPVLDRLRREGLELTTILVTHHHGDHTGGVDGLCRAFPDCRVWGPDDPRIRGVTDPVRDGDRIRLPVAGAEFRVLGVPGHTSSHLAYYGQGALLCGDTLFCGGCGRVFDGTFEQLAASLERIAGLPPDTLVYCAHEYTLDNLGFAKWVEPDNTDLLERQRSAGILRESGRPTVPCRLDQELATNPFLRTEAEAVVAAAQRHAGMALGDRAAVFRELREWKDREYD